MLVLSRKLHEKILIGECIVIQITEITPGKVKIGIEAPNQIPIVRHELLETTEEETQPQAA